MSLIIRETRSSCMRLMLGETRPRPRCMRSRSSCVRLVFVKTRLSCTGLMLGEKRSNSIKMMWKSGGQIGRKSEIGRRLMLQVGDKKAELIYL